MVFKDSKKNIFFYSITVGFVMAIGFNNCSKRTFSVSNDVIKSRLASGAAIFINDDAEYTNQEDVTLSIENNSADEMYVTDDVTCKTGGSWEPYGQIKLWKLSKTNSEAKVYVKFREKNAIELESECYADAIIHDDIAPTVTAVTLPPEITKSNSVSLAFSGKDALSGIAGYQCVNEQGLPVPSCIETMNVTTSGEGSKSIKVVAKDRAQNYSQPLLMSWIVDQTPPDVLINQAPPLITSDRNGSFVFTGTDSISPVVKFKCQLDNAGLQDCVSGVSYANLAMGQHTFQVIGTDEAGNSSQPKVHTWTIDAAAPSVRITSGPESITNSATAAFQFEGVGEPIAFFECRIDSGVYSSCVSGKSYAGLSEGTHEFFVIGTDSAGNKSAPASLKWDIDRTAPIVSITSAPPEITNQTTAQILFTVVESGSGIKSTECRLNGTKVDCVLGVTLNNLNGPQVFTVQTFDNANNPSNIARHEWTVDTVPPSVNIVTGPVNPTKEALSVFSITASDNITKYPVKIQCRLNAAADFSDCSTAPQYTMDRDGAHVLSARAVDAAGNTSDVDFHPWVLDTMGPAINFTQFPANIIGITEAATITWRVEDQHSTIASLECTFDGAAYTPCTVIGRAALGRLPIKDNYTFQIRATDALGNPSTNSVVFSVVNNTEMVSQPIQVSYSNKADIIIVIDNSGSMKTEQSNMAARFGTFLDVVKNLDWRVAIVTTDVEKDTTLRDGRFIEMKGMAGNYFISSSMDFKKAREAFAATIQRPASEGSGNEQGIAASLRAVQRSQSTNVVDLQQVNFFRNDASLSFVVVTDANETNSKGTQTQNMPETLFSTIKSYWPQKAYTYHSIVVKTDDSACLRINGNEAYGKTYEKASGLTGGIIGSVCAADYSNQLAAMGEGVINLVKTRNLNCIPQDLNGDGRIEMNVILSGGASVPPFTVTGQTIQFDSYLPAGSHELQYYCLKN